MRQPAAETVAPVPVDRLIPVRDRIPDDPESRELRTGEMIVRTRDVTFVFGSLLFVAALWVFL